MSMITDTDHHYFALCDEDMNCTEPRVDDPYHVTCHRCIRRMLKGAMAHKCQCGLQHVDLAAATFVVELSRDKMFVQAIEHSFERPEPLPDQDWQFEISNMSMNANRALEIAEGPLFSLALKMQHQWLEREPMENLEANPFCTTRVFHRELAKRLQKMDCEQ